METKLNYTLVGLFVVLLGGGLIATVLWLAAATEDKQYDLFRVYTSESVSGLNPKAAVKYRGVQVGRVANVALDRQNPERVEILLEIERGTPVREDTRAILTTQGLTGLTSLELTGGHKESPALEPQWGEPPPVIISGPSLAARLDNAFNNVMTNMNSLSERLGILLNDHNLESIANTLDHVETISATFAGRSSSIEQSLDNLAALSADLRQHSASLGRTLAQLEKSSGHSPELIKRVSDTALRLGEMAQSISSTSSTLQKISLEGQRDLRQWGNSTGPQVNTLLLELAQLAESLRRLTTDLDRNPRMLLLGKPVGSAGPGE